MASLKLEAIKYRDRFLHADDEDLRVSDRRWLIAVVDELEAALRIVGTCRCTDGFQCSGCKALDRLNEIDGAA